MKKLIVQLAKLVLLIEARAKMRQKKLQQRLEELKNQHLAEPLVSVIVPVYNVEAYLTRCLDSVFGQTYRNLEIICVNDCSTDGSLEILEKLAQVHSQLKIINNETNSGAPMARKRGLEEAQGEYVLFVDADDWLEDSMISDLMLLAQAEQADLLYCDYFYNSQIVRARKKEIAEPFERLENWSFTFGNTLWNRFVKRELLEKVKFPQANMGDDLVINTQLYYYAKRMVYCGKPLYHHAYLENQGSISASSSQKNFAEMLENYRLVYDFCQEKFGQNEKIDRLYAKKVAQIKARQRIVGEKK